MERVFVDVNVWIDVLTDRKYGFVEMLDEKIKVLSALSFHIVMYIRKLKVPNALINSYRKSSVIIPLNKTILKKSLIGPTDDFEDNIQLHSAVEGDCEYFVTMDKKLLKMKYFGKMKICDKI